MLSDPAPYSRTTPAEMRSADIFHSLLDRRYVQGEIKVQDKIPNIDGALDITDEELHPIGKIEVQLKTLDSKYYESPKYSCTPHFIAYCYRAQVPVLLILVDQTNKRAYWRHIDVNAVHEFRANLKGQTYALPVPKENCLDGENHHYVNQWTGIIRELLAKARGFDSMRKERDDLLNKVHQLLRNPIALPIESLKEVYRFLDVYNYILDREFPSVKKILYPDYWKIGIGVVTYKLDELLFLLFPVEYTSSQTLVKSISVDEYKELESDMLGNNVLLIAKNKSAHVIQNTPTNYAYRLLCSNIKKEISRSDMFVASDFAANEYVLSFIDKFCAYLGLPEGADTYDIADLDFRLNRLMPMLEGSKRGFAEWVTEFDRWIDSDSSIGASPSHAKAIQLALKDLESGVVPKVKVKLYSNTFNLETIFMHMKWLIQQGHPGIQRVYIQGQFNLTIRGVDRWKTWNIDVLWSNFQIFFQNFFDVYDLYVETHFPAIAKSLGFFKYENFSVACVMRLSDKGQHKPNLELYFLAPIATTQGRRVFCFRSDDDKMPFERKAFRNNNNHCTIEGTNYEVIELWGRPLDFMFANSPLYEFLKSNLSDRISKFFEDMSSIKY